jgi:exodeoxyribonuclease-5
MIELNTQQLEAVKKGKKWFKSLNKQVFEIAGFAGTGKSTIVDIIIKECNLDISEVLFTAFVGKAAMILAMKGLPAKTIHSTFYDCIDVPKKDDKGNVVMIDGRVLFTKKFIKKKKLPDEIKLIVIDEASMVNKQLRDDILSFAVPVIALGDLHQLPPVFGDAVFLVNPDVILTEIMRQKADNPIIHLATLARERRWDEMDYGRYGTKCLVCHKKDLLEYKSLLKNSNVVICGKNATRESLNGYIRKEVYGIESPDLIIGDKLICRQNNWEESLGDNIFLINGMIGFVDDIDVESYNSRSIDIDFRPEFMESKSFTNLTIDYRYLNMPYGLKKTYMTYFNKFEFGYAITCHLSQGSQYNKVLIYNERMGDDEFYSKWLYTAITRAIDKLVIAL